MLKRNKESNLTIGNSKFIKLLTFHLRTPICIKHTSKWQKNINKYKKIM